MSASGRGLLICEPCITLPLPPYATFDDILFYQVKKAELFHSYIKVCSIYVLPIQFSMLYNYFLLH